MKRKITHRSYKVDRKLTQILDEFSTQEKIDNMHRKAFKYVIFLGEKEVLKLVSKAIKIHSGV